MPAMSDISSAKLMVALLVVRWSRSAWSKIERTVSAESRLDPDTLVFVLVHVQRMPRSVVYMDRGVSTGPGLQALCRRADFAWQMALASIGESVYVDELAISA